MTNDAVVFDAMRLDVMTLDRVQRHGKSDATLGQQNIDQKMPTLNHDL